MTYLETERPEASGRSDSRAPSSRRAPQTCSAEPGRGHPAGPKGRPALAPPGAPAPAPLHPRPHPEQWRRSRPASFQGAQSPRAAGRRASGPRSMAPSPLPSSPAAAILERAQTKSEPRRRPARLGPQSRTPPAPRRPAARTPTPAHPNTSQPPVSFSQALHRPSLRASGPGGCVWGAGGPHRRAAAGENGGSSG